MVVDKICLDERFVEAIEYEWFKYSNLGGRWWKTVLIKLGVGDRARFSATERKKCVTGVLTGPDAFMLMSQIDTHMMLRRKSPI